MKASAVRKQAKDKADAERLAGQFADVVLTFSRKAGEQDHLFGSVTSSDIAESLEKKGFDIDRRKIHLDEPIKALGEFSVPIRLHRDVTTHVKVRVEKEVGSE
jgi:large subunit ribosomal protein L9